jgi:hypothetical protein
MILVLDNFCAMGYLQSIHPVRDSDHDSDRKRNGWGACWVGA